MIELIILMTTIYFDPGVNMTPYLEVLPAECQVRIDFVSRNNRDYDGYAWYSGRIIIYDGNNMSTERKQGVLLHEIGYVCARNNRKGSYLDRELNADKYSENLL